MPVSPSPRILAALAAIALLLATGCGDSTQTQQPATRQGAVAPAMPPHTPLLPPGVQALVIIGDLQSLIDGLGRIAAQCAPQLHADAIRAKLGGQMGDPALLAVPRGAGAAILALDDGTLAGFLELDANSAEQYAAAVRARGQQAIVADGLLVLTDTSEQMNRARPLAAAVRTQILAGTDTPSVHFVASPARFLQSHPQAGRLFGALPMFAMTAMQRQGVAPTSDDARHAVLILTLHARIALSLLNQCETLELAVSAPAAGLRADIRLTPRPDTNLSRFLARSPGSAAALAAMLPGRGALRLAVAPSPTALHDLMLAETQNALAHMTMSDAERAALLDTMTGASRAGIAVDLFHPGSPRITGAGIYPIANPQTGLESLRSDVNATGLGVVRRLRDTVGAEGRVELVENVRTCRGAPVELVRSALDFTRLTPESAAKMHESLGSLNIEIAFLENKAVWASGDQSLDPLVEACQGEGNTKPPPMLSEVNFGSGGAAYVDLDLAAIAQLAARLTSLQPVEGQQLPAALTNLARRCLLAAGVLAGAQPATAAAFLNDGKLEAGLLLPDSLLTRLIQMRALERMKQQEPPKPSAKKTEK